MNEIVGMLFKARYVLVLMSLFSIYMGALYNEFFNVPADFGSAWRLKADNLTWVKTKEYTYGFGVDPVWRRTDSELLYYNSLKMKMSIILGVLQMSLGLFLKLGNAIHFRHWIDIFFEFIPQVLFLWAIFGYLCFLIFFKWSVGTADSPLLLNVLIGMILPSAGGSSLLYESQKTVESALIVIAFVSAPLMLIPKPVIIKIQLNKIKKMDLTEEEIDSREIGGYPLRDFKFSEVVVHQVLETIEFILGTISHTASYLRLWALSLAHSELSLVLWNMLFAPGMAYGSKLGFFWLSGVGSFLAFGAWLGLTFFVLVFMESLSASLHALRLHWVEFQSKFFKGDGYIFKPLDLLHIKHPKEKAGN